DRLHLIIGPLRRTEGARWDFRGLIGRMVLRDRFRSVDREERRIAAALLGGSNDGLRRDLAVEGPCGEIDVRFLAMDGLREIGDRELYDLDLGRVEAVLLQNDLEQVDVGLGLADDADPASRKLADLGDLRTRLLALALCWRPQHYEVLAQRCDRLRI